MVFLNKDAVSMAFLWISSLFGLVGREALKELLLIDN